MCVWMFLHVCGHTYVFMPSCGDLQLMSRITESSPLISILIIEAESPDQTQISWIGFVLLVSWLSPLLQASSL